MRLRRKPGGHFCWCCGRVGPNERFSGRGTHVCQDCSKLSQDEVAYRKAVRKSDQRLENNAQGRNRTAETGIFRPLARTPFYEEKWSVARADCDTGVSVARSIAKQPAADAA